MKPTQALHEAGQSLWLDNITRALAYRAYRELLVSARWARLANEA